MDCCGWGCLVLAVFARIEESSCVRKDMPACCDVLGKRCALDLLMWWNSTIALLSENARYGMRLLREVSGRLFLGFVLGGHSRTDRSGIV